MNIVKPLYPLAILTILAVGCSDDDNPYPYGVAGIGAYCQVNYDCADGFCCTSPPCGHGMCSYRCAASADCPYGALCDGGVCYSRCQSDPDCYVGQHCKPGKFICQY
ncbi:MAG TPA: hypothetical protein VIV60_17355 [Polyangiaceae bacterium]